MSDSWRYTPPLAPLEVVHQDRDLVVVNKPSGLLSVPGRAPEHHDSAESRVTRRFGRCFPVHRLDLDTSGLLVLATRRKAERELFRQFRQRLVEKTYLAWVSGVVSPDTGTVDLPLKRREDAPRSEVCRASGRPAETFFSVLTRTTDATLLRLHPRTGRSHQLRVHLLSIGHPILGDRFYAPADVLARAPRLLLHAHTLQLAHPYSGEPLRLQAPLPFSTDLPHLEPAP